MVILQVLIGGCQDLCVDYDIVHVCLTVVWFSICFVIIIVVVLFLL